MFGYINKTRDNKWKPCSRKKFEELISSDRVHEILADVRSGKVERKRELPAFIFSGTLDKTQYEKYVAECQERGEKPRGSRCEEFLKPTGLFMMDFDRTEGNPRDLYDKFVATMEKNKILLKDILATGHKTAKNLGLRLVLKGRPGSTIEADQKWISELMQEPIDEVCKDFSRLSYCPCKEDIYYIDYDMLFGGPYSGIYDSKLKIVPSPNLSQGERDAQPNCELSIVNCELNSLNSQLQERCAQLNKELVVKALEEQMGGAPKHGGRNTFIFAMACHLALIYGKDPQELCAIIPTYGETIARWQSTIKSACNTVKDDSKVSDVLMRALGVAEKRQRVENKDAEEEEEEVNNEPPMPTVLPPLVAHLTSNVPDIYKPSVANAIFPPLGAHLGGVKFRYIDNVLHEAAFMCVLMAIMSSGKSCVNMPIKYIMADIEERDKVNRKREQEWKNKLATKGANKDKPERPDDLCVQVLVPDMTNAAFVQRLQDAKGKFLYTQMDEIELLDQLKTSARGQQVSQIIRLAFDCGTYGQERVGSQSVNARVKVKWNWNASTTILKGQDYFRKGLMDGTLSRLNFCTINVQRGAELPVFGTYDDHFAEVLKPYIDHLNEARGEVYCTEARVLIEKMMKETKDLVAMNEDSSYEILSYRALVIAFLKAMVLYIAHGYEWSKEIEDFVRWSYQYDMWCKSTFFGERMLTDLRRENFVRKRGPRNMLEMLPEEFTESDVVDVRISIGKDGKAKQMIANWLYRRLISVSDGGFRKVK